ncbi:aspartic proteinase 36-like [Capsicum chacoense]
MITLRTGDLSISYRAIDEIFGLGKLGFLIIVQLSTRGVTPTVFSHCLKGSNGGVGVLVLGQVVEPNLVYTPLVQSQQHYNVILESIALNGQTLSINPQLFKTPSNMGALVDSETTVISSQEAHNIFVNAIATSSFRMTLSRFRTQQVGLEPMVQRSSGLGGSVVWCVGFQKSLSQGWTVLGDIVLKDKIIVYDLDRQRIGWANYDCNSYSSQVVNVSTTRSQRKAKNVKSWTEFTA